MVPKTDSTRSRSPKDALLSCSIATTQEMQYILIRAVHTPRARLCMTFDPAAEKRREGLVDFGHVMTSG